MKRCPNCQHKISLWRLPFLFKPGRRPYRNFFRGTGLPGAPPVNPLILCKRCHMWLQVKSTVPIRWELPLLISVVILWGCRLFWWWTSTQPSPWSVTSLHGHWWNSGIATKSWEDLYEFSWYMLLFISLVTLPLVLIGEYRNMEIVIDRNPDGTPHRLLPGLNIPEDDDDLDGGNQPPGTSP